jgi:hypothetical protein
MWKEMVVAHFKPQLSIWRSWVKRRQNSVKQTGWHSNRAPPKYKCWASQLHEPTWLLHIITWWGFGNIKPAAVQSQRAEIPISPLVTLSVSKIIDISPKLKPTKDCWYKVT